VQSIYMVIAFYFTGKYLFALVAIISVLQSTPAIINVAFSYYRYLHIFKIEG